MALRKGLQRVHRVMLTVTALVAGTAIVGSLMSAGEERWFILAFGLIPLVLYLSLAWIVAGFLDRDNSSAIADGKSELSRAASQGQMPVLADRWPRFWARSADIWISTIFLSALVILIAPGVLSAPVFLRPGGEQLLGISLLPFAMVLDAAIVAVFGNSLGKAIAGIRVGGLRGERLPFGVLVQRNMGVWWSGLAAGIPLANLYTLWRSSQKLLNGEILNWDRYNDARCYAISSSLGRTFAAAGVSFAAGVAVSAWAAWAENPSRVLQTAVTEINESAPLMIDETTRLDGAAGGLGGELIYLYTVTDISSETHNLASVREVIDGTWGDNVKQGACGNPAILRLLDLGVPVVYQYSTNDGIELSTVRVDALGCQ